jgi:UDP-N-acetylglucosamine:LPS N-acetylglucosamine transferase
MKIPGDSMGKFLSLLIFKIILVLYIIFIAVKLVVVILVESISGLSAHQEENLEKLSQSPIGKHITDPVLNSKMMLSFGEKIRLVEQSLVSTKQKDNATTKKQNSFS